MELQLLSAGKFNMGSRVPLAKLPGLFGLPAAYAPVLEEKFASEIPYHPVTLSKGFYVGTSEVTREQFKAFVDAVGYTTDAEQDGVGGRGFDAQAISAGKSRQTTEFTWMNPGFKQDLDHPVTNVSWNDATEFCKWLSKKEGRIYVLPSEAQWEYACRAQTSTLFHMGDQIQDLTKFGNVLDQKAAATLGEKFGNPTVASDGYVFTSPVKSFAPNANKLYDMHGNVAEWCQDWHGKDYYGKSPAKDPTGPPDGKERVLRGGNWINISLACRSAARAQFKPQDRFPYVGFRIVLKLPE